MDLLLQSLIAVPVVLLGLWAGIRLRRRINGDAYRKVLKVGLWIIAGMLIVDVLTG